MQLIEGSAGQQVPREQFSGQKTPEGIGINSNLVQVISFMVFPVQIRIQHGW